MSRIRLRSAFHVTSLAIVFLTCALLTAWIIKSSITDRDDKAKRLTQNESKKFDVSGKASSPFTIELNSASGTGTTNVVFDATVTQLTDSIRAQNQVEFEWILPEGVQITSGERLGSLGSLQVGQSVRLSAGFSVSHPELNQHVHLHVFRMVDGEPHGQMAQFNTGEKEISSEELKVKSLNRKPASRANRLVE